MIAFEAKPLGVSEGTSIRSFRVNVPQAALDDLRRRILATQFPERETVRDRSQGAPLKTVQKLARYWATEYDWRRIESKINSYPQFITEIEGLDIHFTHVRSKHSNALPLLACHGWPGTFIERLKAVDGLVDPTAYAGTASDAFDVVIPSMPGYGFSGKPTTTGWDPARIARAWAVLMKRLGYARYAAQGSDWGAITVDILARQGHPELIGIHTSMPGAVPNDIGAAAAAGAAAPAGLSPDEKQAYEQLVEAYTSIQYALIMGSRPQMLYGIADSPIGLAAFLLDAGPRALDLSGAFDGRRKDLTRDEVLDMITLFWLTNTGVSAARLYWENKLDYFAPKNVTIPVAVSAFPDELFVTPRSWAERAYSNLIHYNKLDKGGHYPSWEQPELFTAELRAAFRTLR
jgi:pimeloyl-ACP methyl ester carboxylesterase